MGKTRFSPWPNFTEEEAKAVSEVLLSNKVNYWTGEHVALFEREYAEFIGVKYAVALANGTVALEAALKALSVKERDEVIVTSRSFFASASAIKAVGATPVFADVDLDTQNIDVDCLDGLLSKNTAAIICVHLAGWPCDMDEIMQFAKTNKLSVIEDCAQAHGAEYKGKKVGSIGDVGCWSFCQDKIISTGGEGGMITTNNADIWQKVWSYKDHGKDYELTLNSMSGGVDFKWVHNSFGTNLRMTEMQAVIGRIQTQKLPKWNDKRRANIAKIYNSAKELPDIRIPKLSCKSCRAKARQKMVCSCLNAAYKCYLFVDGTREQRDALISEINKQGVPCFSGSCPEIYLEKAFQNSTSKTIERFENAKKLGETSIMFLCHPTLTEEETSYICKTLKDAYDTIF